jgi:hypothetical protein
MVTAYTLKYSAYLLYYDLTEPISNNWSIAYTASLFVD